MSPSPAGTRRVLLGSPFNVAPAVVPPAVHFAIDDQVSHDRYGLGRVVGTQGDAVLLVDFGSGVRRVAVPDAKLTKL